MGILPMTTVRCMRSFFQKIFMSFVPYCKKVGECFLCRHRQGERNGAEFFPGWQFRSRGQISPDNRDLVELTELNRYIMKYGLNTAFSINDCRINREPSRFQCLPCSLIFIRRFQSYFLPVNVLLESWTTDDQNSVSTTEEGRICHGNNWLRSRGSNVDGRGVQLPLHPRDWSTILLCELDECLPMPDIFIPESFLERRSISFWNELPVANQALKTLSAPRFAILFNPIWSTIHALFL